MRLWDWAIEAYEPPDARTAWLELQDAHGQSVPFLMWAAWAGLQARSPDPILLDQAGAIAREWEAGIGGHLRAARRRLKPQDGAVDDEGREALRSQVKAAELSAERLLLESLEIRTRPTGWAMAPAAALRRASAAYGPPAPADLLDRLASLLQPSTVEPQPVLVYDRGDGERQMDDSQDPDDAGIRARIAVLRIEHHDLDAAVAALTAMNVPDMVQIARLKKKKLALRDQIAGLEDQLTPDIIA